MRLPLDVDRISEEVAKTISPASPKEFRAGLDEAYARELKAQYTQEEMFELKDKLLREASLLADEQRGSWEEIRAIPAEEFDYRTQVIECANAVLRVLNAEAQHQATQQREME